MKKILAIIALTLVGLVAATTVTLALVKTDVYDGVPCCANYIRVYKGGSEYAVFEKDTETFKKVQQLHSESLTDNLLSTLFQGALGYDENIISDTTVEMNELTKEGIFVEYIFDNSQTLKFQGKDYLDESTATPTAVTYKNVILEVKNTDNYTETTVYFFNNVVSATNKKSDYQIKMIAHQSQLFDYLNKLEVAGN